VILTSTAALAQSAQPGTTPSAPILNRQGPLGGKVRVGTGPPIRRGWPRCVNRSRLWKVRSPRCVCA